MSRITPLCGFAAMTIAVVGCTTPASPDESDNTTTAPLSSSAGSSGENPVEASTTAVFDFADTGFPVPSGAPVADGASIPSSPAIDGGVGVSPPPPVDDGDADVGIDATPSSDDEVDIAADGDTPGAGVTPDIDESEPAPEPLEPEGDDTQSGLLTAGSFDDNLNLAVYESFVADLFQENPDELLPYIPLGELVRITVLTQDGDPVGDARVVVHSLGESQEPLIDLTTHSDGRVVLATGLDGGGDANEFEVTIHPPDGGEPVVIAFDLDDTDWTINLPEVEAVLPSGLDLALVIDATGSMGDELEFLKIELDEIVAGVADLFPDVEQRYALVVYRDHGDAYVTRTFDFTDSLSEFQANLADQSAAGGGDYPEAMHLALEEAVALDWRADSTARVMFLIADAPPHDADAAQALDAIMDLRRLGVSIYPVAASGVAAEAEYIMRTAALFTLAEYLFLTDDSGIGNPHAEPHIPCYVVQRLDTLMTRMIRTQLAGARIEPAPETIIRVVGNPVDGVCMEEAIIEDQ
ncbi:MAG: VWA domain-containing protein [Planctomycetes bacterium]|nr:VWA domain-containing protein [Planctomycetota bacterium]